MLHFFQSQLVMFLFQVSLLKVADRKCGLWTFCKRACHLVEEQTNGKKNTYFKGEQKTKPSLLIDRGVAGISPARYRWSHRHDSETEVDGSKKSSHKVTPTAACLLAEAESSQKKSWRCGLLEWLQIKNCVALFFSRLTPCSSLSPL